TYQAAVPTILINMVHVDRVTDSHDWFIAFEPSKGIAPPAVPLSGHCLAKSQHARGHRDPSLGRDTRLKGFVPPAKILVVTPLPQVPREGPIGPLWMVNQSQAQFDAGDPARSHPIRKPLDVLPPF